MSEEDAPIKVPEEMKREWRNFVRTERRKRKSVDKACQPQAQLNI